MIETLELSYHPVQWTEVEEGPNNYAMTLHPPWDDHLLPGAVLLPSTQPILDRGDRPGDLGKGHTIPVLPQWQSYLHKINPGDAEYRYSLSVGYLWINIPYTPPAIPMAESIISGRNIVRIIGQSSSHYQIECFKYTDQTSGLDPEINNYEFDRRFWKMTTYDIAGRTRKVTSGLDVYAPLMSYTDLGCWIHKDYVRPFPSGPDYIVRGDNVYDGNRPLRIVENGIETFYNGWTI
jgi:hypothetical protein